MSEQRPSVRWGEPLAVRCRVGRLTAVRHGESLTNARFAEAARTGTGGERPPGPGDAEVPLSGRGARQAVALGGWLARLPAGHRPDLVLCSPYRRAWQTWSIMAEEAARHRCAVAPALVDARLRDREMGVFELMAPAAIEAAAPAEAGRRARAGEWYYRPPGGESHADVALRVGDLLTRLDAVADGGQVLVVAHDAVVAALRYVIRGLGAPVPEGVPPVPTASVTRWVSREGRLRLDAFGDTGHLDGEA